MESSNYSNDLFFKLAQWLVLTLAFLLPFWFLPFTSAPVEFNKVLMVSVLGIAAFIFYLIHAILKARISIVSHKIFLFLAAVIIFWFLSSIFSEMGPQSIWGTAAETSSFFNILVLFLISCLIPVLFPDTASLKKLFLFLSLGFVIFMLFTIISIFGLGRFFGGILASSNFNTIGSWNSISLAAGFFIMIIYAFLTQGSSGTKRWFLGILFLVSLFIIAIISFPLSWVFLGVFALLYLSYAIWRRHIDGSALLLSVMLLSVSVFGFTFKSVIPNALNISSPVEVGVSHKATYLMLKDSLRENPFFGKGPASFRYIWDIYKPRDVNNTVFWAIRFDAGSSYILSLLGEIGTIGWILFLGFLGYLWYLGLNLVTSENRNENIFLSSFFLFSYTILMWMFYPVGYTLLVFGFFSIGFLLASLRIKGSIKVYDILIFGEGPMGFVSAMAVVMFMIAGLSGFYIAGSKYAGQVFFSKALAAFSENNFDLSEKRLLTASSVDKRNSAYTISLSQLYFVKAQLLLQDKETSAELLSSRFKDTLDKAIFSAQESIRLSPLDFESYRSLGNIYRFLVSLNTQGSREAALAQFNEATKRSPKNPALFRDKALTFMSEALVKRNISFLDLAQKELENAIELKQDYAAAHFLLAQIFDSKGNSKEAIKRGEAAALISPNDVGTLFQLGLLYYKDNRLEESEIVLKRAILINPNYSNARYFLGLIYDKTGRQKDAILEFEKISSLNPKNEEVSKILSNLHSKKSALSGISPPGPSPEKRQETPVKDNSEKTPLGR